MVPVWAQVMAQEWVPKEEVVEAAEADTLEQHTQKLEVGAA